MVSGFFPSPHSSFRTFPEIRSAQRSPQDSPVAAMKETDTPKACNIFLTSPDTTWLSNTSSAEFPSQMNTPKAPSREAVLFEGMKAVDTGFSHPEEDPAMPQQLYELMSNDVCISAIQLSERFMSERPPSVAAESNVDCGSTVRRQTVADAELHSLLSSRESSTTAHRVHYRADLLRQGKYPCAFPGCTKTFDRRYNLKVHGRRHTGETPYTCRVKGCMRTFKWRSSMSHHNKSHERLGELGPNLPIVQDKNIGTYKDPFGRALAGDERGEEPVRSSKTGSAAQATVSIASTKPRTCTEHRPTAQRTVCTMPARSNSGNIAPQSLERNSCRALGSESSKRDASHYILSDKVTQEAFPVCSPVSDFSNAFKEPRSCPVLPRSAEFEEFSAESFSEHETDGCIGQSDDRIWPENGTTLDEEEIQSMGGFHQDVDETCIAAIWPAVTADEQSRPDNVRPLMHSPHGQLGQEKLSGPNRNVSLESHCPIML